MFKKEDNNFKQSFQNYHRENAILRLLCKECHKKKQIVLFQKNKLY